VLDCAMSAPWSCWRSQSVGPIGHDAEYPQRTLAAIRAHMSNRAWQNPRYVSEGETLTFNIFILQVFKYYQVIIACVFISTNLRPLRATHLTGSSFSTRRSAAGRPMELMLGIRTVGLLRGWKTGAPPTLEYSPLKTRLQSRQPAPGARVPNAEFRPARVNWWRTPRARR
jgi:hypothetical protein